MSPPLPHPQMTPVSSVCHFSLFESPHTLLSIYKDFSSAPLRKVASEDKQKTLNIHSNIK